MKLIAPLSEVDIADKSYDLFRVVTQAPVSLAYSEEKKWNASRLTMHGAFNWDEFLPWVEDPQDILTFLDHHFDLVTRGDENQDEPIRYALRALGFACHPATIEALNDFDPTGPSFVRGICYVFQDNKPFELRRAAFFFLALVSDKFFNTTQPIMGLDEMKNFCVVWASTVDDFELEDDVKEAALTVLLGMINSPHWRPHIVTEKWKLLEYFTSIPRDSQALRQCIDNPELIDAIKEMDNPAASFLWLGVLWLKYQELIPDVRGELEVITKDLAQGKGKADLDRYLTMIESELERAEEALTEYDTWSTDPDAINLRTEMENLQGAKSTLVALKQG